jgi:hypothetical protein
MLSVFNTDYVKHRSLQTEKNQIALVKSIVLSKITEKKHLLSIVINEHTNEAGKLFFCKKT